MRERLRMALPVGVHSVLLTALVPWFSSTMPVETCTAASRSRAPTHSPARAMCSKPEPSGNSNEGEREVKLLPMKP